jgi:hypothetical protein
VTGGQAFKINTILWMLMFGVQPVSKISQREENQFSSRNPVQDQDLKCVKGFTPEQR